MGTSRRGLPALVGAIALAGTLATAEAAEASCAPLPSLAESLAETPTVFVGTVIAVSNQNRTATFLVEELWKGEANATVIVNGGPPLRAVAEAKEEGLGIASSVDRRFRLGWRYLVMPPRSRGSVLQDNSCTATRPYTIDLARFRPAAARTIAVEDRTPEQRVPAGVRGGLSTLAGWIVAGLVLGSAGALGIARFLRRRRVGPRGGQ